MSSYIDKWNKNYINKRYNIYPYDRVVTFILRNYRLEVRKKIKVLDLGCGGGNHIKFLSDQGFDYYGVDGSEESIRLSNELIKSVNNKKLIVSEFLKIPFENNFFDAIIDRQSTGHNFIDNIEKIISELYRVLKKGGKIHSHVFGSNDNGFNYGTNLGNNDYSHFTKGHFVNSHLVHRFTSDEIRKLYSNFTELDIEKEQIFKSDSIIPDSEIYIINATK